MFDGKCAVSFLGCEVVNTKCNVSVTINKIVNAEIQVTQVKMVVVKIVVTIDISNCFIKTFARQIVTHITPSGESMI